MKQPPNPFAPPGAEGAPPLGPAGAYASVPFYRKNSTASALLLFALALAFAGPFFLARTFIGLFPGAGALLSLVLGAPLLAVCVIVLTGDVYYDAYDERQQLKKWGIGNKVVAALIIAGWGYTMVTSVMS
ncbi:MAG: hypothetical protein IPG04_08590 [Polyangiaceae bacterium]|jgi:hypothetical protein|nr:hypothetical protein [Polyangiaceae bacterium]